MDQRRSTRSGQRSSNHSSSNTRSNQRTSHSSSQHQRGRQYNNRSSGGPIQELVTHSSRRLSNHSTLGIFLLAFLGGGLVTLGVLFGVALASQVSDPIIRNWLLSVGIATGLFILIGLNAILFTEPNVIMPTNFYNRTIKQGFLSILHFWVFAWIGNFLGAYAFAWFIQFGHSSSTESVNFISNLVNNQLMQSASGASMTFWEALFSGILSNWVLGFALIYSVYNRAAVGKVFILLFTVCMIVTTNLQFFPLNLSYFSLLSATGGNIPSWFAIVTHNLIPVSVGNLIGGSFLVALPLLFQTKRMRVNSQ